MEQLGKLKSLLRENERQEVQVLAVSLDTRQESRQMCLGFVDVDDVSHERE